MFNILIWIYSVTVGRGQGIQIYPVLVPLAQVFEYTTDEGSVVINGDDAPFNYKKELIIEWLFITKMWDYILYYWISVWI